MSTAPAIVTQIRPVDEALPQPMTIVAERAPQWECIGWQREQGTAENHEAYDAIGGMGARPPVPAIAAYCPTPFCCWYVKLFRDARTGRIVAGASEHGHSYTALERDMKAEAWWNGARDVDLAMELGWRAEVRR